MASSEKRDEDDKASPFLKSLGQEFKRFIGTNIDVRIKACIEIGHIIHLGDESMNLYVSRNDRLIKEIIKVLMDDSTSMHGLQLAAMQTLSILVRCSSGIRVHLQNHGVLEAFLKGLKHSDEGIRIYTCHALFFFIAKRPEKLSFFFNEEIKGLLHKAASDDWNLFLYNDAEEIMRLMDIPFDPFLVSGCINSRHVRSHFQGQVIAEAETE